MLVNCQSDIMNVQWGGQLRLRVLLLLSFQRKMAAPDMAIVSNSAFKFSPSPSPSPCQQQLGRSWNTSRHTTTTKTPVYNIVEDGPLVRSWVFLELELELGLHLSGTATGAQLWPNWIEMTRRGLVGALREKLQPLITDWHLIAQGRRIRFIWFIRDFP